MVQYEYNTIILVENILVWTENREQRTSACARVDVWYMYSLRVHVLVFVLVRVCSCSNSYEERSARTDRVDQEVEEQLGEHSTRVLHEALQRHHAHATCAHNAGAHPLTSAVPSA